jgi:hypothetical protein
VVAKILRSPVIPKSSRNLRPIFQQYTDGNNWSKETMNNVNPFVSRKLSGPCFFREETFPGQDDATAVMIGSDYPRKVVKGMSGWNRLSFEVKWS